MLVVIVALFVLGYLAIVFEHQLGVNKSAAALLVGVLTWTAFVVGQADPAPVVDSLVHHLGDIAGVVFFLLGAMVIVELVDAHGGFEIITSRITTTSRRKLLLIVTFLSFTLSAVLDNLTTSIVMMSLVRKLTRDESDRMQFGGMVIIAANAGGAWSPIGDVTTTMLWVGGQLTTFAMMKALLLPSIACVLIPFAWIHRRLKGDIERIREEHGSGLEAWQREIAASISPGEGAAPATALVPLPADAAAVGKTLVDLNLRAQSGAWVWSIERGGETIDPSPRDPLRAGDVLIVRGAPPAIERALRILATNEAEKPTSPTVRAVVFATGLGALLFVPVFKTLTHLPPFMGILLGLGVVWTVTELLHKRSGEQEKALSVAAALQRVDSQSVLFFLGILLAIGALGSSGILPSLASSLDRGIGNVDLITLTIGLSSSVVDNVPLVAAAQGMYPLTTFPTDHAFWLFLAYCAGTGGSILIIGSAAGIAVMGIQRISFGWYVRHMSLPALLGYAAGAGAYLAQRFLLA